MKPQGRDINTAMKKIFLTHTVQMKLGLEAHYKPSYILLLNPHGSDETIKYINIMSLHHSAS